MGSDHRPQFEEAGATCGERRVPFDINDASPGYFAQVFGDAGLWDSWEEICNDGWGEALCGGVSFRGGGLLLHGVADILFCSKV